MDFHFTCKESSQRDLLYIRPAENNTDYSDEEQIHNLLEYVTWDWVSYRALNYPNWYAGTDYSDAYFSKLIYEANQ